LWKIKRAKVTRFEGTFFLKSPYVEYWLEPITKISHNSYIFLLSSITCDQIWLIPFVDHHQCGYITKLKNKTLTTISICRVDWPVTENLSPQGRPDPKGGFRCFWCPNKTWNPPIGTSDTLTIVKNWLEIRKLQPPKVKGVKNL